MTEAIVSGVELVDVFAEDGADTGWLMQHLRAHGLDTQISVWRVATGVLSKVGSVVTSQGLAAIAKIPDLVPAAGSSGSVYDFVVELVAVSDPGNAGTIVRSAVAAGAQAIVFGPNSVDPWNPKALRASAGAVFKVPVLQDPQVCAGVPTERMGADPHKGEVCDEVDFTGPVTLVVGNEAHGLDGQAASGIDRWVSIPMLGAVESMNVATATAVLCYEIARQRRAVS
ncbi:MAG: RNA methyltransferase [Acidimicrobiia bacterium]|nr:RNA methyltransferase [Acidimicrobiia bacterium]MYC57369.1 RNA methyltransferase [Acidimicrobiia bacterium]MYG94572.1 RNA methyltransferase [Acidimicrobiia bacterium]MYI31145.1 RNA methyltransferase [Acidimicrobiia bacterium]